MQRVSPDGTMHHPPNAPVYIHPIQSALRYSRLQAPPVLSMQKAFLHEVLTFQTNSIYNRISVLVQDCHSVNTSIPLRYCSPSLQYNGYAYPPDHREVS